MRHNNGRLFAFMGVFTAITILLTYVFSIQTTFLRLSFGFIPISIFAVLFGPLPAGVMAAAADLIGTAFLGLGVFFPGFLVTDFLYGILFGTFLYQKPVTIKRAFIPFILMAVLLNLGLNTVWLTLFYGKAWEYFFYGRLVKNIVWVPFQVLIFYAVYRAILPAARELRLPGIMNYPKSTPLPRQDEAKVKNDRCNDRY